MPKALKTPRMGKSKLVIEGYEIPLTYVSDAPMMLLQLFLQWYDRYDAENYTTPAITLNADDWAITLILRERTVFRPPSIIVIREKKSYEHTALFTEDIIDITAKQIADDILADIDEWTLWTDYKTLTNEEIVARKEKLTRMANELRKKAMYCTFGKL